MKPPVYITGATGFIGRHVCQILIAAGYDVTAIIRKGSANRLPPGIACTVEVDDIFTQSATFWAAHFQPDAHIIHLAWTATPGEYINDPQNLGCLVGTLTMAEGAIKARAAKFTGIGTCIEYRMGDAPLGIDTPLDPQSPYAGAKAAAFTALSTCLKNTDTAFAWCRLFNLHGEGEHPNRLIASLHTRLSSGHEIPLSDGAQVRDFLDVADGAHRIAATALGPLIGPVNICSGIGISVRDLALGIAADYGRTDLLKFGARPNNVFDPAVVVGIPTEMPKDFAL